MQPGSEDEERARKAAEEHKLLQRSARAFHADPPLEPPARLMERLVEAFPALLG